MMTITESGMDFGPFSESHCFKIEDSAPHKATQPGVRIAEFLLIRDGAGDAPAQVWIVEAKTSAPNPASPLPGAMTTFAGYIEEIRDKLRNALTLGMTACLGRHPAAAEELPAGFSALPLGSIQIRLILVVRNHQKAWLPPLQSALLSALNVTAKTWGLGPGCVVVLNADMARARTLII